MKLLALSIYERFVAGWLSGHTSCSRDGSAQGFRPGGATFLRRLMVAFALVGVVGTAAAFKGGAMPGPPNMNTPVVSYFSGVFVLGALASVPVANTVLSSFKTGPFGASITDLTYTVGYLTGTAGTGTGTLDITTTAGTSVCAVTVDCTTMHTPGTGATQSSCSTPALSANTTYQVRSKSQCAGAGSFGYLELVARMTVP